MPATCRTRQPAPPRPRPAPESVLPELPPRWRDSRRLGRWRRSLFGHAGSRHFHPRWILLRLLRSRVAGLRPDVLRGGRSGRSRVGPGRTSSRKCPDPVSGPATAPSEMIEPLSVAAGLCLRTASEPQGGGLRARTYSRRQNRGGKNPPPYFKKSFPTPPGKNRFPGGKVFPAGQRLSGAERRSMRIASAGTA
jgi:hypothetical protein